MPPNRTAQELFGHLPRGSKIAMTTRIPNKASQEYIQTFQSYGFQARLITDQTDMQDFCFLKSSQQELVGMARSTFVQWAAYLGHPQQQSRLYWVDSNHSQSRRLLRDEKEQAHFTRPELTKKIKFEWYNFVET